MSPEGLPEQFEHAIRQRGAVLDLEFAHQLYRALHAAQSRVGVEIVRDLAYGEDERHRLDIYRPAAARGRGSSGYARSCGGWTCPSM